jgi:hypothetical protein
VKGVFEAMTVHFFLDIISNRFYLDVAASLADDEKISYRLRYVPQIQADNLLPFFLLDGLYDGFEDLTTPG